jgi:hypothetical protein
MSAPGKDDPLIEVVAGFLYRCDYPRRRWDAVLTQHTRGFYLREAQYFIRHQMGGEAELYAFCESVLATVSAPDDDELELDELVARLKDLIQKIERDISEGGYLPGTVLPALIDVAVWQLLDCTDPEEAFRHFVGDLLAQFHECLDEPDEE